MRDPRIVPRMLRVLLVCVVLLGRTAQAQDIDWRRILPPDLDAGLVAFAQAPDGELFAASEQAVYIRSPYGEENGWERINVISLEPDERVTALAAVRGVDDVGLLLSTDSRLFVLSWGFDAQGLGPWDRYRYKFLARSIELPESFVIDSLHPVGGEIGDSTVRAYASSNAGRLLPILASGGALAVGNITELTTGAATLQWAVDSQGGGVVWAYGGSRIWRLTETGEPAESVDLAPLLGEGGARKDVRVTDVFHESTRKVSPDEFATALTFIGTSHGLFVAESANLETATLVHSARDSGVVQIGTLAGRLWVLIENPDTLEGFSDPLLLEQTEGRRAASLAECAALQWLSPPSLQYPGTVEFAMAIEDDLILAEAGDGNIWSWTPSGWQPTDPSNAMLRGFGLWERGAPSRGPVVLTDVQGTGLWYRAPPNESYWYVRSGNDLATPIRDLVPCPSAQGAWALERSPAGSDFGMIRFETPYGSLCNLDGHSVGSDRLDVQSLSLRLANGRVLWPESRHGGLLLPSGFDWIHAESGVQQRMPWPLPEGERLRSCLPGGMSSETAWLAILEVPGLPDRVVRLDLAESQRAWSDPELELELTNLEAPEEALSVLLSDSEGQVWFATYLESTGGEGEPGWTAQRIDFFSGDAGDERFLGTNDPARVPRYLWWAPDGGMLSKQHLLLTAQGVTQLPRNEPPLGSSESFTLLPPPSDLPGSWAEWFPGDEAIEAHSIFHSELLHPDDTSATKRLLLTQRLSEFEGSKLGGAYEFSLDAPTTSLVPLQRLPWLSRARAIEAWLPENFGSSELVYFTAGSAESTAEVAVLSSERVTPWATPVPNILSWSSVVGFPHEGAGAHSLVHTAGTDSAGVAFRRLPMGESIDRGLWMPAVPVKADFLTRDSEPQALWLPGSVALDQLPSDAHTAHVRIAPSYRDWWVEDLSGVRLTDGSVASADFDESGVATLPLNPGSTALLSIEATDPWNGSELAGIELPVTLDEPDPDPVVWIVGTLVGLAAVAFFALVVVAAWRRMVLAWIQDRHWILTGAPCEFEGYGSSGSSGFEWSFSATDPNRKDGGNGISGRNLVASLSEAARVPAYSCARIQCEHGSLDHELVSSLVVTDRGGVVIGCVPERYRVQARPTRQRRLHVSVELAEAALTRSVRRRVRQAGFSTQMRRRESLSSLLERSHVVIAAHERLELLAQTPGAIAALARLPLRARLLVLSGTAPDLDSTTRSSMSELVQLGVAVLWLPGKDGVARGSLLLEWSKAFFPAGSQGAHSLGEALVQAWMTSCSGEDASAVRLYGDPTLQAGAVKLFDAFLSHAHEDQLVVGELRKSLGRRWSIFGRKLRVCRDIDDFQAGELHRVVPRFLAASNHLVVCCSLAAAQSEWVRREIDLYLQDHSADSVLLCDLSEPTSPKEKAQLKHLYDFIEERTGLHDVLRAAADNPSALVSKMTEIPRSGLRSGEQPSVK